MLTHVPMLPPAHLLGPTASLLAISSPYHSLFKVLFIFPSRYLFAIGLLLIFSFRWNLPPTLSCTRKQLDSMKACLTLQTQSAYGTRTLCGTPSNGTYPCAETGPTPLDYNSTSVKRQADFQVEHFPVHSPLLRES